MSYTDTIEFVSLIVGVPALLYFLFRERHRYINTLAEYDKDYPIT